MLCGPNLELVYASESLIVACMCDFDYRTAWSKELPLVTEDALQKELGLFVVCREGFIYLPHVSARDVRTVCQKVEKICRVVPTK